MSKPYNTFPKRYAPGYGPSSGPATTILNTIQPAYYEQPSSRVALGSGPSGTGFASARNGTQPTISVCLCPAESVIGPVLSRHQDGGMAFGKCPSNLCDASQEVPQNLNRYGAMKTC